MRPLTHIGLVVTALSPLLAARQGPWFYTQQAELTPQGLALGDWYGRAVAISGNTAVVGAYMDDVGGFTGAGSVTVFEWTGTMWTETLRLDAPDPQQDGYFGRALDIDGNTLVVGCHGRDLPGIADAGVAYVFERNNGAWPQLFVLQASDASFNDEFGSSVAIDGGSIVCGAQLDDLGGSQTNSGSAYVFERQAGNDPSDPTDDTWDQVTKLQPTDTAAAYEAWFGSDVSISGNTIVVGATHFSVNAGSLSDEGSAYVFELQNGNWDQVAQLVEPTTLAGDRFGHSVAIDGVRIVIGAPSDDSDASGGPADCGSFSVLELGSAGAWPFKAKFFAREPQAGAGYGCDVAIEGDRIVVGAVKEDFGASLEQGSAYVLDNDPPSSANWVERARLIAGDGETGDWMGIAVDFTGDTILAGAIAAPAGNSSGTAYVFVLGLDEYSIFCEGDPSCPCGNAPPAGSRSGCVNSTGHGASLMALGSSSILADDLRFLASSLRPNAACALFCGPSIVPANPFSTAGLKCVGGPFVRFNSHADSDGEVQWGPGLGTNLQPSSGDTRYFQVWFRDPWYSTPPPCAYKLTNFTSGVAITFSN